MNFLAIHLVFGSECPSAEIFAPCICNKPDVRNFKYLECGGDSFYDLEQVFSNISKRSSVTNFRAFYITNTAITELKNNTFKDITFDQIFIKGCKNLSKIQKDAFAGTNRNI